MTNSEILHLLDGLTISVGDAAKVLGISKSAAYDIVRKNADGAGGSMLMPGVPVHQIGSRYTIATAKLRAALGIDDEPRQPQAPAVAVAGFSEDRLDALLDALLLELLVRRLPAFLAAGAP